MQQTKAPEKGQRGVLCYRDKCDRTDAFFYNHSTQQYYCTQCAHIINERNGEYLCTLDPQGRAADGPPQLRDILTVRRIAKTEITISWPIISLRDEGRIQQQLLKAMPAHTDDGIAEFTFQRIKDHERRPLFAARSTGVEIVFIGNLSVEEVERRLLTYVPALAAVYGAHERVTE